MNENFETKLKEAVKEAIYDCDRADVIEAWNEVCNSDEDHIYPMEDFDEVCDVFCNMSASEIIREVSENFHSFDTDDDYFYMDYGEYRSTDDVFDIVDDNDLAEHVIGGDVEIDGLDLDEIKEEVRKECGSYRAFKTIDEFKQTIPIKVGESLVFRIKDKPESEREAMLIELDKSSVTLGSATYSLGMLFDQYEYRKDNEWVPFGVLDVTDNEKTEDNSNED